MADSPMTSNTHECSAANRTCTPAAKAPMAKMAKKPIGLNAGIHALAPPIKPCSQPRSTSSIGAHCTTIQCSAKTPAITATQPTCAIQPRNWNANSAARNSGSSRYEVTSNPIDHSGPLLLTGNSVTQCQSLTRKMPAKNRTHCC